MRKSFTVEINELLGLMEYYNRLYSAKEDFYQTSDVFSIMKREERETIGKIVDIARSSVVRKIESLEKYVNSNETIDELEVMKFLNNHSEKDTLNVINADSDK